jgi:hypothetical protein
VNICGPSLASGSTLKQEGAGIGNTKIHVAVFSF